MKKSQFQLITHSYKEYIRKKNKILDYKIFLFLVNSCIEGFIKKTLVFIIEEFERNFYNSKDEVEIIIKKIFFKSLNDKLSKKERQIINKNIMNIHIYDSHEDFDFNNIRVKKGKSIYNDIEFILDIMNIKPDFNILDSKNRNSIAHGEISFDNKSPIIDININFQNKIKLKKIIFGYEKIINKVFKFIDNNF
ncbi:hypothetical protein [Spiroplasma endosymbiont of Cantharis rufa]|uniref:hypothetical protein n=1 Tax=Spiroplasma endosymbiont of Cantharis rufa TaxID=3066279 RepID=UPI0030D21997